MARRAVALGTRVPVPLSILDLATIGKRETPAEALEASVALARHAEAHGYRRVWYAEHHNIASIASSATAVLIAHVATQTTSIRLGAGGIMLPNHSPLVIAEQFGTLATLHPDRIDLGLGRAPGSDQATARALRRDPRAADTFPQDVLELRGYLTGETVVPGVHAIPGAGTDVPLYILGSSLFGAKVAAVLGLPYGFASHFAPAALHAAVELYRQQFQPSDQLDQPYVIAGVNATVSDTEDEARRLHLAVRRARAAILLAGRRDLSDDDADRLLASPQGRGVAEMMRYTAVGTPTQAAEHLEAFATEARADELIVVPAAPGVDARLRSVELVAEAMAPATA
jgi:luciferase family oxidoreductase group 1